MFTFDLLNQIRTSMTHQTRLKLLNEILDRKNIKILDSTTVNFVPTQKAREMEPSLKMYYTYRGR